MNADSCRFAKGWLKVLGNECRRSVDEKFGYICSESLRYLEHTDTGKYPQEKLRGDFEGLLRMSDRAIKVRIPLEKKPNFRYPSKKTTKKTNTHATSRYPHRAHCVSPPTG